MSDGLYELWYVGRNPDVILDEPFLTRRSQDGILTAFLECAKQVSVYKLDEFSIWFNYEDERKFIINGSDLISWVMEMEGLRLKLHLLGMSDVRLEQYLKSFLSMQIGEKVMYDPYTLYDDRYWVSFYDSNDLDRTLVLDYGATKHEALMRAAIQYKELENGNRLGY